MPEARPERMQQGSVPVPDPTLLTTENLRREILGLRELLENKLDGAMAVQNERFLKVDLQFELVERQRVEQKQDTKTAVDAALSAQKEAVHEQTLASDKAISKSESGTTKQIEQLAETFRSENSGIKTTIDDLKDRVRGIEATKSGGQQSLAQVLAIIGTIAFIVSAGVAVIILTR